MNGKQIKKKLNFFHFKRSPEKVMILERLGSFHQSRLSFTRQLIDNLIINKCKFGVLKWSINSNGFGNAILKTNLNKETISFIVFCHQINDNERSDRVIAEKWDMTFSLFDGEPTESELDIMSKNLKIQESGRHLSKQLTLSRANKSVRIFNTVLDDLSKGKQPSKKLINEIGYLVRTTAVYANGKFGVSDYSKTANQSFLNKPFQTEMLTVYFIRYFSIELINYLAKEKGKGKAVKLSEEITKHIGVGNATGLGMAPFLINHQELLHKWIDARETAISRVFNIKKLNFRKKNKIRDLLKKAYKYSSQWKVIDLTQYERIKILNKNLEKIIYDNQLLKLLNSDYPLKNISEYFADKICIETQEILYSIFIEPFPNLIEDLFDLMSSKEKRTVQIGYNVNQLIQKDYSWALKININNSDENYFFWYTSQNKLEPRLGKTKFDHGFEKQLPFDIPHQVQKALKILKNLPREMSSAEAMLIHPEIRYIIKRVITNKHYPFSEIKSNLVGKTMRPIDLLRCKLSFFGASKYDPKSNLWTRITLFQGAPMPHQLNVMNSCEWLFPYLSIDKK